MIQGRNRGRKVLNTLHILHVLYYICISHTINYTCMYIYTYYIYMYVNVHVDDLIVLFPEEKHTQYGQNTRGKVSGVMVKLFFDALALSPLSN